MLASSLLLICWGLVLPPACSSASNRLVGSTDADAGSDAATDSADGMPFVCQTPWHFPVPAEETVAAAACPPAWPKVSYGGSVASGPLSTVTITTAGDPAAGDLAAFGADLVASGWWQALAQTYELDPAPTPIHWTGPTIPPSDPGAALEQSDVETYIRALIQAPGAAAPAPPAGTLPIYMLYLPPDVVLGTPTGPNTACAVLGAYHLFSSLESPPFLFGVVQRCVGGITSGPGPLPMEQLTIAGSHEVAEIVTDPYLNSGYRVASDPPGPWLALDGEIADLCPVAWYREGQWTYSRFWSNAAAVAGADPCLPGPDTSPSVFIGQVWTPLPPSHTIRIPLTGCNLEGQSVWRLNVSIKPSAPNLCASAWIETGPKTSWPAALVEPAQKTASLLIALDPDAPSGSAAVALLSAHPSDTTGANLPEPYGADVYSVGVFVP